MATKPSSGVRIQVHSEVLDLEGEEEGPPLAAYAFASSGKLLARNDLESGKTAVLALPASHEPDRVRFLVGPRLATEGSQLLADLIRIGASEKNLHPAQVGDRITMPVERSQWACWLRFCRVRGTLTKPVSFGTTTMKLPVCGAEVEVYEVDPVPVIVARIPDHLLERLREVVIRPNPDPGPLVAGVIPDNAPGLIEALAARVDDGEQVDDASEVSRPSEGAATKAFRFAGTEQRLVSRVEAVQALEALSDEPALVRAAKASTASFRDALAIHPLVVRSLLCFLWPRAVNTQLVATTTTDECGRFRAVFYRGCTTDVPDLYFKAYRQIAFWRFPIYAPTPISCWTFWDYPCGTEVHLSTTSPFAQTCPPCPPVIAPDHWVLAMAVGNTSLASVRGASASLASTTDASNLGLTDEGQPWGGYLRFRFEFDHSLRIDLGVSYYRVSWRKVGSGNPYVPLTDTQLRHYIHQVGTTFPIDPYVLGPKTVGVTPNLFEMPPAVAPAGGQWVVSNAVVDTASAGFDSTSMAPAAEAGLYEFKLDLFDGSGAQVNASSLGVSYRVPTTTDLTVTIPTAGGDALGLVTAGGSLVFRLRIDNNPCTGSIGAAQLGLQSAADECGVLTYTADAQLSLPFEASHPHGFAIYRFRVVKGLAEVLIDGGAVGPVPGAHALAPTVGELRGVCETAGFAEDLDVTATATDGWGRQSQLDAHPLPRPFVLTPP